MKPIVSDRAIDLLIVLAIVAGVLMLFYNQSAVNGLERRVSVIEGNRFSSRDAIELQQHVLRIIGEEVPPDTVREALDRHQAAIDSLRAAR